MVDALFEALGFKRIATSDGKVIKPIAFERNDMSQCDTCGDYHPQGELPRSCETGDGE